MAESQPRLYFKCNGSLETGLLMQGQSALKLILTGAASCRMQHTLSVMALTLSRFYLRERTCNAGIGLSKYTCKIYLPIK